MMGCHCGVAASALVIISHMVITMAAGSTTVPIKSINTENCMERQAMPQRSDTMTSSIKLWTVELIHRLRCDRSTVKLSGTTVLHRAWGTKIICRLGNVRSMSVDRKRSSPNSNRFFAWSVVTTFRLYSRMISGLARMGTQAPFLGALIRYMLKQPGRQVTPPKNDSNAFA